MLTVKTKIQQSPAHGFGLFADEFIPKGTLIWKLQKGFDIILTQEQFSELPKLTQDYIIHYSYFDTNKKCHVVCGDNARFFNKSEIPNCGNENGSLLGDTMALKDIEIGEELTEIYYNLHEINQIQNNKL